MTNREEPTITHSCEGSSSATEWGESTTSRATAREKARTAARTAAAEGCEGKTCAEGDGNCKYEETSIEILESETFDNGQISYKAKSSGRCACRK
jgi:hypothetical protein